MNELAQRLREVAAKLIAEADKLDAPVPQKTPTQTLTPNIYSGVKPSYGPVPAEFANPKDPYGTRPDIGSPGWQTTLRQWAAADGKNRNQFVRDKGLTPIWPDEKQDWEH